VRRIALIAASLAALSGCGGEATITKKPQKAPVTVADWRTDADVACLRVQNAFVERAGNDLRQLRRRLPGVAREVRGARQELAALEQPDDAAVERFVNALPPLQASLARLVTASRTMKPGRLATATRRLEPKLAALATSAHRSGLQCLRGGMHKTMAGAIKAPIAAERLAAIENRMLGRVRAAVKLHAPTGPENIIAALEDEDAALRTIDLPHWVRRELAAYRRASRDYRAGLRQSLDIYNSGVALSHEQWVELIKRRAQNCARLMQRVWDRLGADPVHDVT
jgi:hypothetical protein